MTSDLVIYKIQQGPGEIEFTIGFAEAFSFIFVSTIPITISMRSISHYCLAAFILIAFASCQREPGFTDTVTRVNSFDSTQLIKSITQSFDSGMPDADSTTETYSYDTINRTITLTWASFGSDSTLNGSSSVYSYN